MPIVSLNMSSETTATSAKAKKDTFICPICDNIIKEAVGKRQGQDAIECSGSCATWLHKHCAGLSKEAFLAANKSDKPFYCPQCRLNIQELEINSLRDIVKDLSSELTALKRTIDLTRLRQPIRQIIREMAPQAMRQSLGDHNLLEAPIQQSLLPVKPFHPLLIQKENSI